MNQISLGVPGDVEFILLKVLLYVSIEFQLKRKRTKFSETTTPLVPSCENSHIDAVHQVSHSTRYRFNRTEVHFLVISPWFCNGCQ